MTFLKDQANHRKFKTPVDTVPNYGALLKDDSSSNFLLYAIMYTNKTLHNTIIWMTRHSVGPLGRFASAR